MSELEVWPEVSEDEGRGTRDEDELPMNLKIVLLEINGLGNLSIGGNDE
jgi:hypothetical protein